MKKQVTTRDALKPVHLLFSQQAQYDVKPNAAQGLRDLCVDELKYLHWAEISYLKSIPNVVANTSSDVLISTIESYISSSRLQISRLNRVFAHLGEPLEPARCEAMTGLIKESEQMMIETEKGMVRDAGIISSTQKIQHCLIATYGTLCSFARTLGEFKSASLLQKTLLEKKSADKLLSEIAENSINIHASSVNDQDYDIYEL
jgi:ferritin-like metal-binding protein YciE